MMTARERHALAEAALETLVAEAEIAAAALLHSVYSHCPEHPGGRAAGIAAVAHALGGRGSALERRVRAYSLRGEGGASPRVEDPEELFLADAEIVAIAAANELDMHLGGEFRYSGRGDALDDAQMRTIERVCAVLGVAGLARSLAAERAAAAAVPASLVTRMPMSYRISADKQRAVAIPITPSELLQDPA